MQDEEGSLKAAHALLIVMIYMKELRKCRVLTCPLVFFSLHCLSWPLSQSLLT